MCYYYYRETVVRSHHCYSSWWTPAGGLPSAWKWIPLFSCKSQHEAAISRAPLECAHLARIEHPNGSSGSPFVLYLPVVCWQRIFPQTRASGRLPLEHEESRQNQTTAAQQGSVLSRANKLPVRHSSNGLDSFMKPNCYPNRFWCSEKLFWTVQTVKFDWTRIEPCLAQSYMLVYLFVYALRNIGWPAKTTCL